MEVKIDKDVSYFSVGSLATHWAQIGRNTEGESLVYFVPRFGEEPITIERTGCMESKFLRYRAFFALRTLAIKHGRDPLWKKAEDDFLIRWFGTDRFDNGSWI